eukprot:5334362-Amphidinium_carterae.1
MPDMVRCEASCNKAAKEENAYSNSSGPTSHYNCKLEWVVCKMCHKQMHSRSKSNPNYERVQFSAPTGSLPTWKKKGEIMLNRQDLVGGTKLHDDEIEF